VLKWVVFSVAKCHCQNETGLNVKMGKMGKIGKRKVKQNIESRGGAEQR